MSDVERLEAEYRARATKLIYASFETALDPQEQADFERLGDRLSEANAADFARLATGDVRAGRAQTTAA